jgi:F0F1-type ATP synthase assembly protein I
MKTPKSPLPPSGNATILRQFGMFGLVLSSFAVSSGVGVGLGWYLWKKQGFPWWTILLTAFLGLFAASYQVFRYQITMDRLEKQP